MIQDIEPKIYNNAYLEKSPGPESVIIIFEDNKVLCKYSKDNITYPLYSELKADIGLFVFLFSIDHIDYFALQSENPIMLDGYTYEAIRLFRNASPKHLAFAGITAYHLYCWYRDNKFCGRCGSVLEHSHKERMLHCKQCNNMIYPKISPGIIVAVTNGDKLLLTKYAGREYTEYALVAGFTEIGESIEKTVEREVMEEVGLKVKNIRFYKSQPWSYSGSLLCGFFAEVDGDSTIVLDTEELAEAGWFTRDEILLQPDSVSLTREMIMQFKMGK